MGLRRKLAAAAGLAALALGQPASSGETELVSSGGWRVVEVWEEGDWLAEPECVMRYPADYESATERLQLSLPRDGTPELTVERVVAADGVPPELIWPPRGARRAPDAPSPEYRYPKLAYGFSTDRATAEEAVGTVARLHYRPADAGDLWLGLDMTVEPAFLDGMEQAGWLILWELDEAMQPVGQTAIGIGAPAQAVAAARKCLE